MQVEDDDLNEVKGQQRSNIVNYAWSEESMMPVEDDDLNGGQKWTEVKYSKLCSMATKLGQKNH